MANERLLTPAEADAMANNLHSQYQAQRKSLHEMYRRNAHLALGYTTFAEMAQKELHLSPEVLREFGIPVEDCK